MVKFSQYRGVIAIEMAFILGALALGVVFASELSRQTSLQAELDNVSYAAVNMLSEQELLFKDMPAKETSGASNLRQALLIDQVVRKQLAFQWPNFDERRYAIRVEAVTLYKDEKVRKLHRAFESVLGNRDVAGKKENLSELVRLSPFTSKGRYKPMYRVSVYYQPHNVFPRIFDEATQPAALVSSSISVSR